MNRLLSISLILSGLSTISDSAQLDTNNNGLSDVWERQFNDGQLFSSAVLAANDDDGDGRTNLEESTAGTDPNSGQPPLGFLTKEIRHVPATWFNDPEEEEPILLTPEAYEIDWQSVAGKRYVLLVSQDLTAESWTAVGEPVIGDGQIISFGMLPTLIGGQPAERLFWRVAVNDIDSDGDGLFDYEEHVLGLNPNNPQTFQGIDDLWLATHFPDGPSTFDPEADPDGDGLTNRQEHYYGTNPNSADIIGPINLGFDEEITDYETMSFREENPSDLYEEDSVPGWLAATGEHIEIWDEGDGNPYVELQSHLGAHGVKQEFDMLPGTQLTFVLRYKGRYYWDAYDNAFDLEVEGASELIVNGTEVQVSGNARSHSFMEDDEPDKYLEWHYASVSITAPLGTSLIPINLSLVPQTITIYDENDITYGGFVDLISMDLAVDANRNGEITFDGKDKTTEVKPYRFWINNDQDDVEVDEPVIVNVNDRDLLDSEIKANRDLEDFSRIKIAIGIPLEQLREGQFMIGLKFKSSTAASPAIRIWPNESEIGSRAYLTDGSAASRQRSKFSFGDTLNGTVFIPVSYWTNQTESVAHLIYEGMKKGEDKLVLVLKPEEIIQEIESTVTHLKLLDVREMYQRARIENSADSIEDPWTNDNPSAQTWAWDPWDWPPSEDPDAEEVTAIFVHGWRLKYMDFMNWSDTSYKRLWHQGFKGKFYSFRWATFSGDDNGLPYGFDEQLEGTKFPPGGTTYNASEYRAWLCGPQLASFVNQLPNPGRRSLFAHSMGNVIAGAALRAGMLVDNYALCNAAVSAMSYDSDPALKNNPENGDPWNNLFILFAPHKTPDTDSDTTIQNAYGLENKFNEGNEMPRIFNFGLPEDSALNSWVLNNLYFKPDSNGHSYYYQHVPIAPNLTYKLFQHAPGQTPRQITNQSEAMGYVTKSLTRTAGLDLRTRGSIQDSHDMSSWNLDANHSGFSEVHSAQWRWSFHSTHLFWAMLFDELEL